MGKISDFMDSLNPDTFNCVFSTNGMTLLTDEQYNYRLEEIHKLKQEKYSLQRELNKYKSIVAGLDKWLEEESKKVDTYEVGHLTSICMILNKIKELEEGKDND